MFNLSLKRLKNGVSKERKTKIRSLKSEQPPVVVVCPLLAYSQIR